ncbi:DUF2345 domain-containing protein, partial [Xanthomonas fragariae]
MPAVHRRGQHADRLAAVQAQSDEVRVQSKEGLKLVSANAEVELAAGKTIHLAVAGGASVTIEGGNLTFACPGTITVQAS